MIKKFYNYMPIAVTFLFFTWFFFVIGIILMNSEQRHRNPCLDDCLIKNWVSDKCVLWTTKENCSK